MESRKFTLFFLPLLNIHISYDNGSFPFLCNAVFISSITSKTFTVLDNTNVYMRNCLPFVSTCVHPRDLVGSVLLIVCCFLCCVVFVFVLCLVCLMLPVALDCQFLIAPSVFSKIYFNPLNNTP